MEDESQTEIPKAEREERVKSARRRIPRKPKSASSKRRKGTKIPESLSYKVGMFLCRDKPGQRDVSILLKCSAYYGSESLVEETLIPLITQKHRVSLRSLDWLVTNFSKKNYLVCLKFDREKNIAIQFTNIYNSYDDRLHRNNRKKFDPFRRRTRVYFQHGVDWYETTVGQLWFLKWVVCSGILDYAESHIDEINEDMSITNEKNREEKERARASGKKRKRKSLSGKPKAECMAYRIPHCTKFGLCSDSEEEDEETDVRMEDVSVAVCQ